MKQLIQHKKKYGEKQKVEIQKMEHQLLQKLKAQVQELMEESGMQTKREI